MLRLSVDFKSKYLWLVGYVSMGCGDNNEWSFGGTEYQWSIWVPDIYWCGLGLAIDNT